MLWSQGIGALSVVDRRNFRTVNTIPDYWVHDTGACRPFAGVSNKDASKILGASIDKNGDYVIHYYETNGETEYLVSKYCHQFFPHMTEVKALEVNSEGNVAFLAGISSNTGKPIISAVELGKPLAVVSTLALDDLDYGKPRRIKRIKGYDILLIGCKGHFAVIDFYNFSFDFLGSLEDVNFSEVVDFEFRNGLMFSKGYKEKSVAMINFEQGYQSMIKGSPQRRNSPMVRSGIVQVEEPPKPYEGDDRGGGTFGDGAEKRIDQRAYNPNLNNYRISKIIADVPKIEKIRVANDKRRIYLGGKGLSILQVNKSGEYELLDTPNLFSKLICLKIPSRFGVFLNQDHSFPSRCCPRKWLKRFNCP